MTERCSSHLYRCKGGGGGGEGVVGDTDFSDAQEMSARDRLMKQRAWI